MSLTFRTAVRADVPALVRMLADDELGATREDTMEPLSVSYYSAFTAIESDPNNEIIIAENGDTIAGFLQLTFIPYLTYRGRWRAQIEGVRVNSDLRGKGIGAALVEHAVDNARERKCHLVQLTTDKRRPEALRFYEQLGFKATHAGMKLHL
jgi:ribosomal protein S18 acetylase RimI-like enzyme